MNFCSYCKKLYSLETLIHQSRSQSFLPLEQQSENESSGRHHFRHVLYRCRLHSETDNQNLVTSFVKYFKMVAHRALVFWPLVNGNKALGTRLLIHWIEVSTFGTNSPSSLKGPSQPHLCVSLHMRIWLLYLIRSMSRWRKSLSTTKDNQTYLQEPNFQKNNKISLHHAIQIISMALKMAEAD